MVLLGDTAQDVVVALGPPQAMHYRHSAYVVSAGSRVAPRPTGALAGHSPGRKAANVMGGFSALGRDGASLRGGAVGRRSLSPSASARRWLPCPADAMPPVYHGGESAPRRDNVELLLELL